MNERFFFENCRLVMKEYMKYIVDYVEEIEKLIKVKV